MDGRTQVISQKIISYKKYRVLINCNVIAKMLSISGMLKRHDIRNQSVMTYVIDQMVSNGDINAKLQHDYENAHKWNFAQRLPVISNSMLHHPVRNNPLYVDVIWQWDGVYLNTPIKHTAFTNGLQCLPIYSYVFKTGMENHVNETHTAKCS